MTDLPRLDPAKRPELLKLIRSLAPTHPSVDENLALDAAMHAVNSAMDAAERVLKTMCHGNVSTHVQALILTSTLLQATAQEGGRQLDSALRAELEKRGLHP